MDSETNTDKNMTTGDISSKSGLLVQQQRQYNFQWHAQVVPNSIYRWVVREKYCNCIM